MRFVGRPGLWAASAVLSTLQLAAIAGFVFVHAAPFTGGFWLTAAAAAAIANGAICGFVRSTTCVVALVLVGAISISPFVRRTCPFFIDATPARSPLVASAAGSLAASAIGLRAFDGERGGAGAAATTDEQCVNAGDRPSRGTSVFTLAAVGLATVIPSALAGLAGDLVRLASLGLARVHRRRRSSDAQQPPAH